MAKKQIFSRRGFLKSASAAAAVTALPTIVPSHVLGADAPSNKIACALIGCGGMGRGNMRNLMGKRGVQMVAVCDVDKNNANRAKGDVNRRYGNKDCKIIKDFRDVAASKEIDAVILATPDHWHAIPAIECARNGKDIYGEKPLSHNLREGRYMVDAVHRYGRVWQTGSWQRSKGNFHRACELVRNGRIGKIVKVDVGLPTGKSGGNPTPQPVPANLDYDFWVGPAPMQPYRRDQVHFNWRWCLDYGGSQLMDWIGHHADIAHWGLDKDNDGPVKVKFINATYPTRGLWNAPISYKCECTYADGLKLMVANTKQIPMGTRWYGEKGDWIHVSRRGLWASNPKILKSVIGPNELHLYRAPDHMQNFVDCIRSRQQTLTPVETAHRSASVGHLCMIALQTQRTIEFDPKTEKIIGDPKAAALLGRSNRGPWSF